MSRRHGRRRHTLSLRAQATHVAWKHFGDGMATPRPQSEIVVLLAWGAPTARQFETGTMLPSIPVLPRSPTVEAVCREPLRDGPTVASAKTFSSLGGVSRNFETTKVSAIVRTPVVQFRD